jgi:hypothetical protein
MALAGLTDLESSELEGEGAGGAEAGRLHGVQRQTGTAVATRHTKYTLITNSLVTTRRGPPTNTAQDRTIASGGAAAPADDDD